MKKEWSGYVWERIYPHLISLVITLVLYFIPFNVLKSKNIGDLVNGIVTLDSIIIGFMGAIIPVILSMKNESKFVKYVFDRDSDGLFKKYISETIGYGLLDVCISLIVYIKDIISNKYILKVLSVLFVYAFFLFVTSTYRSMSCMLKLIFLEDNKIQQSVSNELSKSEKSKLWDIRGK